MRCQKIDFETFNEELANLIAIKEIEARIDEAKFINHDCDNDWKAKHISDLEQQLLKLREGK
jgi:hypothetical protein